MTSLLCNPNHFLVPFIVLGAIAGIVWPIRVPFYVTKGLLVLGAVAGGIIGLFVWAILAAIIHPVC